MCVCVHIHYNTYIYMIYIYFCQNNEINFYIETIDISLKPTTS